MEGDVVKLKAGGPWMVVGEKKNHAGPWLWTCRWFVADIPHCDYFSEKQLERKY